MAVFGYWGENLYTVGIMKIVVASKNPVKLKAAEEGFKKMFPGGSFETIGVSVPSGVSDQPRSDKEALEGATNRAENAKAAMPEADFWVGLEGGVEDRDEGMIVFAWTVVLGKHGRIGRGKNSSFFLPPRIAELIREGKELGDADDIVFGRTNSKQANGAVGLLTNDVITRTVQFVEGVVLALIPFKNEGLY